MQMRRRDVLVAVISACTVIMLVAFAYHPDTVKAYTPLPGRKFLQVDPCALPGAGVFTVAEVKSTALASFPGSGNTWFRYLLTTSTANSEHHAVKQTLLIIRNPYEAYLAEFNRKGNYGRHPNDPEFSQKHGRPAQDFETAWPQYLTSTLPMWRQFNTAWAYTTQPLYVIVYNRLKNNLAHELRQVVTFLNQTDYSHCAVRNPEGWAHRKKADWQKDAASFTGQQKKRLNKDIDKVQKALEKKTGQDFSDFQLWKRV